ncbi:hypothetical protein D0846_05590 [Bordetella avium]|nr:hypothetical protein D0849_01060 [Bordetella avium]RIQ39646.1 hypothetical protein D0848_04640 [Bordetella avium]RIQ45336.1 hypothetical protein D0846_05590 [Bordetella avium]RIQ51484.1 hypothetical protein D0845_03735 [Bordetella avium]RIQ57024.1 hypothetical protein D0844_01060 [Bordetella avium]
MDGAADFPSVGWQLWAGMAYIILVAIALAWLMLRTPGADSVGGHGFDYGGDCGGQQGSAAQSPRMKGKAR